MLPTAVRASPAALFSQARINLALPVVTTPVSRSRALRSPLRLCRETRPPMPACRSPGVVLAAANLNLCVPYRNPEWISCVKKRPTEILRAPVLDDSVTSSYYQDGMCLPQQLMGYTPRIVAVVCLLICRLRMLATGATSAGTGSTSAGRCADVLLASCVLRPLIFTTLLAGAARPSTG